VTVTRTGGTDGQVGATVLNGSTVVGFVTFPAGSSATQTVQVPAESSEQLTLVLSDFTGGATAGTPSTLTFTTDTHVSQSATGAMNPLSLVILVFLVLAHVRRRTAKGPDHA
jgi:hypothetical protein